MTNEQKFQECMRSAKVIVESYRRDLPEGVDPKAIYATTTLLIAALVASVMATGVSAYASYSQGQAAKDSANYNAKVAQNAATAATQQAQFDSQQIADRNRRILATQRAELTQSGVDISSGTSIDVRKDSLYQGEMQRLMALYTGKTTATSYTAQSRLDSAEAGFSNTASYVNTGATILGGASTAAMIGANPGFKS